MSSFKEMIIRRTPSGVLPELPLNGKWLETLNFTVGTPINATFHDACLTLSTPDISIGNRTSHVLMVGSKLVRHKPRTTLTLHGFLLKRYGFNVNDRVGICLKPGMIQITKINRFIIAEGV
jgi:hypothetical protein